MNLVDTPLVTIEASKNNYRFIETMVSAIKKKCRYNFNNASKANKR